MCGPWFLAIYLRDFVVFNGHTKGSCTPAARPVHPFPMAPPTIDMPRSTMHTCVWHGQPHSFGWSLTLSTRQKPDPATLLFSPTPQDRLWRVQVRGHEGLLDCHGRPRHLHLGLLHHLRVIQVRPNQGKRGSPRVMPADFQASCCCAGWTLPRFPSPAGCRKAPCCR